MEKADISLTNRLRLQKFGMSLTVIGIIIFFGQLAFSSNGGLLYWISLIVLFVGDSVLFINYLTQAKKNKKATALMMGAFILIVLMIIQLVIKAQYPPPF